MLVWVLVRMLVLALDRRSLGRAGAGTGAGASAAAAAAGAASAHADKFSF